MTATQQDSLEIKLVLVLVMPSVPTHLKMHPYQAQSQAGHLINMHFWQQNDLQLLHNLAYKRMFIHCSYWIWSQQRDRDGEIEWNSKLLSTKKGCSVFISVFMGCYLWLPWWCAVIQTYCWRLHIYSQIPKLCWLKVTRSDYDGFQFHIRDVYSHWCSNTFTFISMWSVYSIKSGDNPRVAVRKKWRHRWVFGDYPSQQGTTLKDLHKLVSFYLEFMKQQMETCLIFLPVQGQSEDCWNAAVVSEAFCLNPLRCFIDILFFVRNW